MKPLRHKFVATALLLVLGSCASAPPAGTGDRWWKGNLHTHSLWSDGDDFPEMIADWYKSHGYDFLAITEHDILQEGEKWVDVNATDEGWPPRSKSARQALPEYQARFGDLIDQRKDSVRHAVRLRALNEYRSRFEEPGEFIFVGGEEISDKGGVHTNAYNLTTAIKPRGGETAAERLRNNLAAIAEQRRATGRRIPAIINHPNYVWALKAEDIALLPDAQLFEVYNGHALVHNEGDADHPSTDRMWDMMLSLRHGAGLGPIFGVATDDAHDYREYSGTTARPGRGWVMVRAVSLTNDMILDAIASGDFYATTGVLLRDLQRDADGIRITIAEEDGATYRTTFTGTRKGSSQVGEVLAEVEGPTAQYRFKGDEKYVRAKIVSSRAQVDPTTGNQLGKQAAWVQPVMR